MFHRESPDEESAKDDPEHASPVNTAVLETCPEEADTKQSQPRLMWKTTVGRPSEVERHRSAAGRNGISSKSRVSAMERTALRKTGVKLQSVEEVWFAGCHCDVGGQHPTLDYELVPLILTFPSAGGAVADDCRYSLADIPLRWMVKQVVLSQCGILFDHAALRRADIEISTIVLTDPHQLPIGDLWKNKPQISNPPSTASGREDTNGYDAAEGWPADRDVLADRHDELKSGKGWWMLEMLPTKYAWQEANGKWKAKWG